MTSGTNARLIRHAGSARGFTGGFTGEFAPRGFTLLELLLVIGIIALLMGILLPAVTKTYAHALRIRTQADLAAIGSGLEAYKADFGTYPPVTIANSGAATLGKALLGPADAAHYYVTNTTTGRLDASDTMQNVPPPTYNGTTVYKAGDLVATGALPTFPTYAAGTQNTVFVCVRNDTQADGTSRTPSGALTDNWWTEFLPYDGNDGNGFKTRLAAITSTSLPTPALSPATEGLPHASAGKVYGPYLDVDRFKTNGPVILDRYGSPILYFPLNNAAIPTQAFGYVNAYSYPRVVASETLSVVNASDNLGPFCNDSVTTETPAQRLAKVQLMLGDYNTNGANNAIQGGAIAVGEPPVPTTPYLLWTAGPDKIFGPRGAEATSAGYSLSQQNYYTDGNHARENQATADAVDDVTNFR